MRNTLRWISIAITLGVAGACRSESEEPTQAVICDASSRAGIIVAVIDSATGTGILSGATIRAVDGSFRDSLIVAANRTDMNAFSLGLVHERAGTYTLSVERLGYQTWTQADVHVTRGVCHVVPVSVTARLKHE